MSYLLTEIALEMLGYKFYDPNGEFHLINFQQSVPSDVHPNEPSLEDFINRLSETEPQQNDLVQLPTASASNNNNLRSTPIESNKFLGIPEKSQLVKRLSGLATAVPKATAINAIRKTTTKQASVSTRTKVQKKSTNTSSTPPGSELLTVLPKTSTVARRTPTKALAKIINYENCNIRSQMLERLEESMKKEVGIPKEVALQKCLDSEIERIKEDANNMKEFRLVLEQRLRLVDARRYDTYQRTFNNEKLKK